ncbi:unnamed protein product [Schistosoma turkestanicum]|nr:unnamed protein product [Schistosoma turkestanicum]
MSFLDEYLCQNESESEWVHQWNQNLPIFPDCGIETLFPLTLVVFTLLALVPHTLIVILSKSSYSRLISCLYLGKLILACISLLLNIVGILYIVFGTHEFTLYSFIKPTSISVSLILFIILIHYERKRNIPNSGVCFYYLLWLNFIWICCCWNHTVQYLKYSQNSTELPVTNNTISVIPNRNNSNTFLSNFINQSKENFPDILDYFNLFVCLIIFILNCNSESDQCSKTNHKLININSNVIDNHHDNDDDNKKMNQKHDKDFLEQLTTNQTKLNDHDDNVEVQNLQKKSPENNCSYLSRITYAWFTRIIIKGFRKPVEFKDLYRLDSQYNSVNVSKIFLNNLDKYLIPNKSTNNYLEKRRASMGNNILYHGSTNDHNSTDNELRRTSAQSSLGFRIPQVNKHSHKSGLTKTYLDDINIRRASEGVTLLFSSSNATTTTPVDNNNNHNNNNDKKTINLTDSYSESNLNAIKLKTHSHDETPMDSTNHDSSANDATMNDHSKDQSTRRSVRIRIGSKPEYMPELSEIPTGSPSYTPKNENAKFFLKEVNDKSIENEQTDNENNNSVTKNLTDVNYKNSIDTTRNDDVIVKKTSFRQYFSSTCCIRKTKFYLLYALIRTYGKSLLWSAFLKLIYDILLFFNPMLLKLLLNFLQNIQSEPIWHGYLYAIGIFIDTSIQSLILQNYFHIVFNLGMKIKTSITAAVYRKSLQLSNKARYQSTTGQIMNLMSSDAQQFVQLMPFINILWSGPFQIIIAMIFLWRELGPSVLAGVSVLLLLLPVNVLLARRSKFFQEKKSFFADSRIKFINELMNGIRVLKLYAWEPSFMKEIGLIRNQEVKFLRKFTYFQSVSFLWHCTPFFVAISSFGVYILTSDKNVLDAQKAFVSLSLFNILRFPLFMFPMIISQLTTIMGSVGSGKSSLLHAILGDMETFNGRINVKGSVAYVPQQPWIFNATLRDNILFHHVYEPVKYQQILHACNLIPDLKILPNGDLTEIGDKGINLSGGQKQRVSIARACYANADIYLLDDPLSAVDAHVSLHLIKHVLSRSTGLLSTKTCILTTHNPKVLPYSDRVGLLSGGKLIELGNYQQLMHSNTSRLSTFLLLKTKPTESEVQNNENSTKDLVDNVPAENLTNDFLEPNCMLPLESSPPTFEHRHRGYSETLSIDEHNHNNSNIRLSSPTKLSQKSIKSSHETLNEEQEQKTLQPMSQPEKVLTGRVKFRVFLIYFKNIGLLYGILVLLFYPINHILSLGTNLWLADWSNDAKLNQSIILMNENSSINISKAQIDMEFQQFYTQRNYRLSIYGLIGVLQVFFAMLAIYTLAIGHLGCVIRLHSRLLSYILHAPATFFDLVPHGRIVNRFSQDIATLDNPVLVSLNSTLNCILTCFLTLCLACTLNAFMIIPICILTVIYFLIQNLYITTSRQLKRLESISLSPIFSHFSETLSGVDSIRAYKLIDTYKKIISTRQDLNNSAVYASIISQRWLAVLLELVGNSVILAVAILSVVAQGYLSAGFSGLVITYALSLNQTLNWLVRMFSELETNIVSIERIHEYSSIEQEKMYDLHENKEILSVHSGTNVPLDLCLYNKFNKVRLKIKRKKFKRNQKSKSYFYSYKSRNNNEQYQQQQQQQKHQGKQQFNHSMINSDIFICSICQMETVNFNMFVQHMALHFNQLPENSTNQSTIDQFNSHKFIQEYIKTKNKADMTMVNDTLNNEQTLLENIKYLDLLMLKNFNKNGKFYEQDDNNNNNNNKELNDLILTCSICDYQLNFDQFTDLMTHLQNKHLVTDYRCNGCEEIFSDRIQCLVHILYYHITTEKPTIQENDTTVHLSDDTNSSVSTCNNYVNTDTKKSISNHENENISCIYQHLNSSWFTDIKSHNHLSTNNTLIMKQQTNSFSNELSNQSNLILKSFTHLMNANKQTTIDLNKLISDQSITHESNQTDKFTMNDTCQTKPFIDFLTMLFWPSLWSVHWMQPNVEGISDRPMRLITEDSNEHMLSKSEECIKPSVSSSVLTSSASPFIPFDSSVHFQRNGETQEFTHKLVDTISSDQIENKKINEFNLSSQQNQSNEEQTDFIFLLRSHPVLGLLPHEIASKVDSYKASKICHLCLKEFTDEMTVLHHQVEEHSLEDNSNVVINSINEQNSLIS